jgi:hypothetical protein
LDSPAFRFTKFQKTSMKDVSLLPNKRRAKQRIHIKKWRKFTNLSWMVILPFTGFINDILPGFFYNKFLSFLGMDILLWWVDFVILTF